MTPRQKDVLDYIDRFTRRAGYPPSYREIQDGLGLGSLNSAYRICQQLHDDGHVRVAPGRARTIEVLRTAGEPVMRAALRRLVAFFEDDECWCYGEDATPCELCHARTVLTESRHDA